MLRDASIVVYIGGLVVRTGRISVIDAAIGAVFVGVIGNALNLMVPALP